MDHQNTVETNKLDCQVEKASWRIIEAHVGVRHWMWLGTPGTWRIKSWKAAEALLKLILVKVSWFLHCTLSFVMKEPMRRILRPCKHLAHCLTFTW